MRDWYDLRLFRLPSTCGCAPRRAPPLHRKCDTVNVCQASKASPKAMAPLPAQSVRRRQPCAQLAGLAGSLERCQSGSRMRSTPTRGNLLKNCFLCSKRSGSNPWGRLLCTLHWNLQSHRDCGGSALSAVSSRSRLVIF